MNVSTPDLRETSLPAWLKPDEFADPDFNPVTYVANLQHYVPLNVLQQELQAHLSVIHNQLVEVINADYDGFVHLTTRMSSLQGSVKRIEGPLSHVQGVASAARETALGETSALSRGLASRTSVSASRALLELMQDLSHVLSKVEKLLAEIPPAEGSAFLSPTSSTPEEVEARCHLLNRVTAEVARVVYLSKKGEELAFVHALTARITSNVDRLQAYLDLVLAAAVAQQVPSALGACLNSYASIDRRSAAEQRVRGTLTRPLLATIVKDLSTSGGKEMRLESLLARFEEGMQRELAPFLSHVLSPAAGIQAFDFLGASVLAEVTEVVQRTCSSDLSPGVPDAFHAGCRAGQALLARLETLCSEAEQVQRFRAGAAYAAFSRLWHLPVYYGLKFQEIAGALEEALESASATTGSNYKGFRYSATGACWRAVESTADPATLLPGLGERFFRLGLTCLARYACWAHEALEVVALPALVADLDCLGACAVEEWLPQLLHELGCDGDAIKSAAHRATQISRTSLSKVGDEAMLIFGKKLVTECSTALSQLRGIVASFRMANRRAPASPSPYALQLLSPLRAALSVHSSTVGETRAAALTSAVIDGVLEAYRTLAVDTLVTVAKTESSLRRLKSRQRISEPEPASSGLTDTNTLIVRQLELDVEALGKEMATMGVQPEAREAFLQLRACLNQTDANS